MAQRLKCLPPMRETWVRSLGQEDPLEKEMATHSSILAWRIPWTEEPGRLQSTGSQRVGHDWATSPSPSLYEEEIWKGSCAQRRDHVKTQEVNQLQGKKRAFKMSHKCMFLGSLSCPNKDLEQQTLKPSAHHSSRVLDKLCYSSQTNQCYSSI